MLQEMLQEILPNKSLEYSPPVDGEESGEPGSSSIRVRDSDGRTSIAGERSPSIFFTGGQDGGGLGQGWYRHKSDDGGDLGDMSVGKLGRRFRGVFGMFLVFGMCLKESLVIGGKTSFSMLIGMCLVWYLV